MNQTPMQSHRAGWSSFFKADQEGIPTWRKEWLEWGLIVLIVLFFSSGFLNLGTGRRLPGSEAESFQLLDQVLVNSIHSFHQFPRWNFYILGGVPYVADPMLHVYNPIVTLPVLALGVLDGYKIALFLSILLAALGAWWLGKIVGMGPGGRLWSACLFACAGQPAIRFLSGEYLFFFGFAWIPWSLASLIGAIQTRRRVYIAVAVLSLALLFFSGNMYYAVFMLVIIGLLAIILLPKFQRKMPYAYLDSGKLKILIVIGVLAFGLVAVQACPLFEFFPRMNKDMSQQGSHTLHQIVLDLTSKSVDRPDSRVDLPTQEYYIYLGWGPLLALLLLPLAIWKHPNKRLILFFGAMLVLTIMMIDLKQMPWKNFYMKTPFLAQFHLPTRALIYCSIAVIMLSGFVIDSLWNIPRDIWKQRFIKFRAYITGIGRLGLAVLIIIILSNTLRVNKSYLHTSDPFTILTTMMRQLRQSDSGVYYVDTFKDFPMSALSNDLWLLNPWYHYRDTGTMKGAEETRPVKANPQYLLTGSQDPVWYPNPTQIIVDDVYAIYKLPHSLPFAFTVPNTKLYDPSNKQELTYEDVNPAQAQLPGVDRVEITASGDQPATLVVLTGHYPGWQVTVDGQREPLLNIGGYLGVDLLPGTHTYKLTFRSTSFFVGLGTSLLSLVIITGLLVSEWQNVFRKGFFFLRTALENVGSRLAKITLRRTRRFSLPLTLHFLSRKTGEVPDATRVIHPAVLPQDKQARTGFLAAQEEVPLKSKASLSIPSRALKTRQLNLALAQINTKLGDLPANLEKHLDITKQAQQDGNDLLVFPELSLTGYVLQDLVPAIACHPDPDDPVFRHLLKASRGIDLVVGFVDEDPRHRFYIASAYLSRGEVVHLHHKVYLPTYGLFDEGRFFAPGESVHAFETRFGRVGMLICEDFWHASPPYLLWQDGADLFLLSSASPGRGLSGEPKLESAAWVELINRAYASLFTIFVAHANRSGFEDGLNFWGGSTVFDPDGKLLVRAPDFEETLVSTEIDLNQLHRTRARLPLLRDERPELVARELERILHGN